MKKKFELEYKRIEMCRAIVEADSKKEARDKFSNCDWDLETEKVDECFNKLVRVNSIPDKWVNEVKE